MVDDVFKDIQNYMREVEKMFGEIEEELLDFYNTSNQVGSGNPEAIRFVYGYSIITGPDGKPVVKEFGNVPRRNNSEYGERKTPVDVLDKGNSLEFIMEMPGVGPGEIKIVPSKDYVEIYTTGNKVYKSRIDRNLLAEYGAKQKPDFSSAEFAYNNGILTLKTKKL